jgi:GNAT superfamily N-acetyltransferase
MTRVLGRACALGAGQALVSAATKVPAAGVFLIQHGFTAAGAYTELRASTDIRLPNPVWPYGYQLRTYAEVNDIAILTEAMNRCYEGLWGHNDVSQEQMAEWLPEFTTEGLFLVFSHSGKVVGISRVECSAERSTRNGAPTGYIDAPGLTPQHRRNDLYRALLIAGLRWLQSQGQKLAEMESWGDRPDLLEMYGEFGFTVLRKFVTYERSLQGMV